MQEKKKITAPDLPPPFTAQQAPGPLPELLVSQQPTLKARPTPLNPSLQLCPDARPDLAGILHLLLAQPS